MSEYGSPVSEEPNQTLDTSDANNSLINKVKSRVSSIFPQRLTQWFSPTTGNSSNGNLRRRRHDSDNDQYDNVYYTEEPSVSDNLTDSDSYYQKTNLRSSDMDMPLPKRSRLSTEADYTSYQTKNLNKHVISSTPMPITINRNRKHLGILKQQPESTPYNFTKSTSTFLSGTKLSLSPTTRISVEQNDPNCLETSNIDLPERIGSRRSLNIPRSSLDKSITNQSYIYSPNETIKTVPTSFKYKKRQQIDEVEEAPEDLDNADEEYDEVLEDDDDDIILNAEIKIAQKLLKPSPHSVSAKDMSNLQHQQQITNGVRLNRSSRFQQLDTASESGESQQSVSSHQRPKSGLFNPQAGQKRSTTLNGLNFYAHLEGKKSLFSEKNLNTILNNSTLSLNSLNRRHQFNSSLYGSTSALSDSRLLNTTSPFYKGRTTYGGASAYNRYSQQRITPTLIRPSSSLSIASSSANSQDTQNNSGISSTAKRILELMNQFTTPLGDAKKLALSIKNKNITSPPLIEHRKRFSELDLIEERRQAIRLGKVRTPYSRPEAARSNLLPPSNELQVPSMAQLLQLNKLQNSTEKVREMANTNTKSILNKKNEEYILPGNSNEKTTHVNKMKQKITTSRQKPQLSVTEDVEDVNLPDIPLPYMKSIPTFDNILNFQKPQSSELVASTSGIKTKSPVTKSNEYFKTIKSVNNEQIKAFNKNITEQFKYGDSVTSHISNHVNKTSSSEFKFSSPINLNGSNSASLLDKSDLINNHFQFSSPAPAGNNEKQYNTSFESKSPNQEFSKNNVSKIIPQLKSGSVLDALKTSLASSSTLTVTNSGFGDQFKKPTNQWSCEVCLINNNDTLLKCAACETPKKAVASINIPSSSSKLTMITSTALIPTPKVTQSFGNAFKPKSGTWECDACLVRNNPDVTSCISCATAKPGTNLNVTSPSNNVPKNDDGFKALVAQQTASKWECSACMTRNDSNLLKCACCEQSKPNSNPTNIDKPKFSFGNTPSSTKFNFGFGNSNPKEQEIKETTDTVTKTDETKQSSGFIFGESNTTKSDVGPPPAQGGFSFGFKPAASNLNDQNKNKDTIDMPGGFKFDSTQSKKTELETLANSTTKGGFSFGIAPTTTEKVISTESASSGFKMPSPKFGVSFGVTSTKNESKVPELASVKNVDKSTVGSSATSLFGIPTKTPSNQNDELLKSSVVTSIDASKMLSPLASEPETSPSTNFVFGNTNQTSTSTATPLFGASSNTTTTSVSSPLFGLTSSSSTVGLNTINTVTPIKSSVVFGASGSKTSGTSPSVFGTIDSTNLSFTGTNTTTTTTATVTPTFNASSNLFAFGGKTETKSVATSSALPVFGSSTLNTGKTFTFGASTVPTTNTPQTTASFVFGKPGPQPPTSAPSPSTSLFGNNNNTNNNMNNNNNTTFGSSTPFGPSNTSFGQSTAPSFGQATPTAAVNPFGSAAPTTTRPAFGNQNTNNQTFGSGSANTSVVFSNIPTNSTGFGVSAPPTFGGTANPPTFGSNTSNQQPVFGTTNSFAGSASSFAPSSSSQPNFNFNDAATKKQPDSAYNFNAPAIPNSGFSFGSNNNNNTAKPAFNFTAQSTPSFNFSGSADGINSTQPFQFGATSLNVGGFNFGSVETPSNTPFQFAASAAATNLFAPTPSPNLQAQQARRKIRTAQRRSTQPR